MYVNTYTDDYFSSLDSLLGDASLVGNSIFCSLRFRHKSKYGDYLNEEAIQQNTEYFFHRLNTKIFRKSYTAKRRSKPRLRLKHFTVCHRHKTNVFKSHIHSLIYEPQFTEHFSLENLVRDTWAKTLWGYTGENNSAIDIQRTYNRKIINYLFTEQAQYDSLTVSISI
jgi:hypothetical protein